MLVLGYMRGEGYKGVVKPSYLSVVVNCIVKLEKLHYGNVAKRQVPLIKKPKDPRVPCFDLLWSELLKL